MSWGWDRAVLLSLSIYSSRPRWKCCMYEERLIHEVQMKSHLLNSVSFHHRNLNKVAAGCRGIASFSHHHIIITTSSLLAILSFPVKKFSWYKTCFLFKSTNIWRLSQQTLHLFTWCTTASFLAVFHSLLGLVFRCCCLCHFPIFQATECDPQSEPSVKLRSIKGVKGLYWRVKGG